MANEKRLKGVSICGECGFYDWKKHRCSRGATKETDPKAPFYDDCPLADAVEVVRCKDCHWWRHINKRNGCGICQHEVFSVDDCTIDPVTEPTDFCSYGERRTEC